MEKYIWNVDIVLKSGKELTMCWVGEETSAKEIGEKLLVTNNMNNMFSLCNLERTKQFFVRVGEVASMAISLPEDKS